MKKVKDLGLEHLMQLNISAARDQRGVYNALTRKYGQAKAKEITDGIFETSEKEGLDAMYAKINADYDVAMLFSGSLDGDIVRKTCNWINDHKNDFGETILEVGCDCGFITTFLAKVFPEKTITAIDRCAEGIVVAKKNADKMGLTNIEFINADVKDFADRTFDTVLSMRVMQENGEGALPDETDELKDQAAVFAKNHQAFADALGRLVKDGGNLISVETLGKSSLFLAWLDALKHAGLRIDPGAFENVEALVLGEKENLEMMYLTKEDASAVDTFVCFMYCCGRDIPMNVPVYEGMDAKIIYAFEGGELIGGYEITDPRQGAMSRIVARNHKRDESTFLWYQNNNGNARLEYHDMSEKQDLLDALENGAKELEKMDNIKVKKIED